MTAANSNSQHVAITHPWVKAIKECQVLRNGQKGGEQNDSPVRKETTLFLLIVMKMAKYERLRGQYNKPFLLFRRNMGSIFVDPKMRVFRENNRAKSCIIRRHLAQPADPNAPLSL